MSDYQVGDTIYHKFTTRAFATGIPTVLAGTPVVSIYEDDSVTQITAGITLTIDFDSVVGLNGVTVVATGGNGFETGKFYQAVITTGTVGGVSVVGETVFTFTLEASAAALDLANGTDGLGAIKSDTAATLVDTSAMQPMIAKIPLSDGSITWNSTALASVNAECDTALTDYDGPTNAEMVARTLLAASYFDPTTDAVATVTTVTGGATSAAQTTAQNDLDIITGATGVNLLTATQASIDAIETDTATTIPGQITALNDVSAAQVNAEVLDVLTVDTFVEPTGIPAATSSIKDKLAWLFTVSRNKVTQTSTTQTVRNDADGADIATSAVSDDTTTFTRGKFS